MSPHDYQYNFHLATPKFWTTMEIRDTHFLVSSKWLIMNNILGVDVRTLLLLLSLNKIIQKPLKTFWRHLVHNEVFIIHINEQAYCLGHNLQMTDNVEVELKGVLLNCVCFLTYKKHPATISLWSVCVFFCLFCHLFWYTDMSIENTKCSSPIVKEIRSNAFKMKI